MRSGCQPTGTEFAASIASAWPSKSKAIINKFVRVRALMELRAMHQTSGESGVSRRIQMLSRANPLVPGMSGKQTLDAAASHTAFRGQTQVCHPASQYVLSMRTAPTQSKHGSVFVCAVRVRPDASQLSTTFTRLPAGSRKKKRQSPQSSRIGF